MALQHVMSCPKCGYVHTVGSPGRAKGLGADGNRASADHALAELANPGNRRVTDGPRPGAYPARINSNIRGERL